jgi:hypothetical protein
MNLTLYLTDDTQLRAHGYLVDRALIAQVCWQHPLPGSPLGQGTLCGSPMAMRRLAELATEAAIQAEEEAAWQARTTSRAAAEQGSRVA